MFHKCATSAAFFAVVVVWVTERGQLRAPLLDASKICWTEASEDSEEEKVHCDDLGALGSNRSIGLASCHRDRRDVVPRVWHRMSDETLPVRGPPIG